MKKSVDFDQYRLMLVAFVNDPLNRILKKDREVHSIESKTLCTDFWDVTILYKFTPDQLNAKKKWFAKTVMDSVTVRIGVEQMVAWSWARTQARLDEMEKKINDVRPV